MSYMASRLISLGPFPYHLIEPQLLPSPPPDVLTLIILPLGDRNSVCELGDAV